MKPLIISLLTLLSLLSAYGNTEPAPVPTRIEAGPLKLDVTISRTAHLFHVVDNLSRWSYYCHAEYAENIVSLTQAENDLLAKHREIRRTHSEWDDNLAKVFYTASDLDTALSRGVQLGWLTQAEAQIEKEILSGLAPRVDELLNRQRAHLESFVEQLKRDIPKLSATAKLLKRFTGVSPDVVPVFLIATPSDYNFGGGFNSGILTLEIPRKADAYAVFIHEVLHAFLRPLQKNIEQAGQGVTGLDEETLEEGIAHALVPGIISTRAGDPDALLTDVQRGIKERRTISDPTTRFYRYALALRPLLREALNDEQQTLTTFLPRAVDVWKATVELNKLIDPPSKPSEPRKP